MKKFVFLLILCILLCLSGCQKMTYSKEEVEDIKDDFYTEEYDLQEEIDDLKIKIDELEADADSQNEKRDSYYSALEEINSLVWSTYDDFDTLSKDELRDRIYEIIEMSSIIEN